MKPFSLDHQARNISTVALIILFTPIFATVLYPVNLYAQSSDVSVGKLANILGKAEIIHNNIKINAEKNMLIYASDTLNTYENTAVKLQFNDGSNIMAFQSSALSIAQYIIKSRGEGKGNDLSSAIDIVKGKVRFFVKPQEGKTDAKFKTSNSVMGIRGTSGYIDVTENGKSSFMITAGSVQVTSIIDPTKSVIVPANKFTEVIANRAPTTPKEIPQNLLKSLDTQSSSVDPSFKNENNSGDKTGSKKTDDSTTQKDNSTKGNNSEAPAPQNKQIYNPDGSSNVASTNSALNNFISAQQITSTIVPISTSVPTSLQQALNAVNQATTAINQTVTNIVNTTTNPTKSQTVTIIVNPPSL